jgi:hypothetical protein
MSASAQAAPSPSSRSFAGVLAELAAPEKKFPPGRDLDGLADDIATLSYESALKTHARYRPSPGVAELPVKPAGAAADRLTIFEAAGAEEGRSVEPAAVRGAGSRKCSSVTVRLTRGEDEQLRQRAAEAGITVSAYLRSCAFEVDALRAQVKQTIAEMRAGEGPKETREGYFRRLFGWRKAAS